MKSLSLVLMSSLILSGCATASLLKRDHLSVTDGKETIGTIFIWSNDVNAGVFYKHNKACFQRAMTARSVKAGANVDPQAFARAIAEVAPSESGNSTQEQKNAAAMAFEQALMALSTTTERTAFVDIGMFYMCQLSANGVLPTEAMPELTVNLFKIASSIGQPQQDARSIVGYSQMSKMAGEKTPTPEKKEEPATVSGDAVTDKK